MIFKDTRLWKCQTWLNLKFEMPKFRQEKCISAGLQHFHRVNHFCSVFHLMQYAAMIFRGKRAQWGQFPPQCGKMGDGGDCGNVAKPHFYPPHIPPTPAIPTSPQLPLYRKFPEFPRKIESPHKMLLEMPELFHNIQTREYLVSSLTDNLTWRLIQR